MKRLSMYQGSLIQRLTGGGRGPTGGGPPGQGGGSGNGNSNNNGGGQTTPTNFPTVLASSTGGSNVGTQTHPITNPAGSTTGDLVIVLFSQDDNNLIVPTVGGGTGWTRMFEAGQNNDFVRHSAYYKVLDGTGDDLTIDTGALNIVRSEWIAYRIAGFTGVPTATRATVGVTNNPPAHNPGVGTKNFLWIVFNAADGGVSITGASSGYSNVINSGAAAGGASASSFSAAIRGSSQDPGLFTTNVAAYNMIATIAVQAP